MNIDDPEKLRDLVQEVLDWVGMVPGVVGVVADLVNAGIYAARGQFGNAALRLFFAIPGIGDAAGALFKARYSGTFR